MKKNFRKILILQTAFLGDVLLTLPMIHHLRKIFQNAEIDIVVRPEAKKIGEISLDLNNVIVFDKRNKNIKNTIELIKTIRSKKYDLLISPHRSFRSSLISFLSRIPRRICFDKASFSFLYTDEVEYRKDKHEIERNLALISEFVEVSDWKGKIPIKIFENPINEKLTDWIKSESKIICIAPFSEWYTKKYPETYFVRLIDSLISIGYKVILLGGLKDLENSDRITSDFKSNADIINFTGRLSISESISIVDKCDLLICNDSAPTHMGTLTSCPVLTIYGSTIPEFGFYPYREIDKVIQIENLYCKPCGIHGQKSCPEKHFRCMNELEPEQVFTVVKDLIKMSILIYYQFACSMYS
ncbi:MAG: glycosyltransferase family 9 protein [Bacteroidetes bacterium]|nr:glycosyltransferase family 9 protein [Bacteroidota bacterium]MBU2586221.1 glycosyltransferase family 9 protein [Bacteroidota bacterium]